MGMRVKIAKRSYPMNVEGILAKAMLLKAYSALVKRRYSTELLDFVVCYKVTNKSSTFLYENFVHPKAKTKVNLGSSGTNMQPFLDEAYDAPGGVDVKELDKHMKVVYGIVVGLMDQNFELEFSKSPELEAFALDQVKMKPKDVLAALKIKGSTHLAAARSIVVHLAFARATKVKSEVEALLKKANGKKPKDKYVASYLKLLANAV